MGFENSETKKKYRWRSSCTPARRREYCQPLWFSAGKFPRPAGTFHRLPSQCWASAGALCQCTLYAGRWFPCLSRSLRNEQSHPIKTQIPPLQKKKEENLNHSERRVPERTRPRLYEPLRRDPQSAATLIIGFAATTASISLFLRSSVFSLCFCEWCQIRVHIARWRSCGGKQLGDVSDQKAEDETNGFDLWWGLRLRVMIGGSLVYVMRWQARKKSCLMTGGNSEVKKR